MSNLIMSNDAKATPSTSPSTLITEVKPAPSTLITPPSSPTDGQTTLYPVSTPITAPAPSTALPDGYLDGGTMLDADGILRPEYLDKYPQQLAALLKPLSASMFSKAFIKDAKDARKKRVPYAAKKNCTLGMTIKAKELVRRKKDPAPAVLVPLIEAATATVQDVESFNALCLHLEAIHVNL